MHELSLFGDFFTTFQDKRSERSFPSLRSGLRRARRLWLTGTETAMRLITAHKILIGSATIFFVFFGLWELNRYSNSNDAWAMARSRSEERRVGKECRSGGTRCRRKEN